MGMATGRPHRAAKQVLTSGAESSTVRLIMITRSPISSFDSMSKAYDSLLGLEAAYLKVNKRKHAIDLTLTSTSTTLRDNQGRILTDDRGRVRLSPEVIEVRAVYESSNPAHVTEYQWFAGAARAAGGEA